MHHLIDYSIDVVRTYITIIDSLLLLLPVTKKPSEVVPIPPPVKCSKATFLKQATAKLSTDEVPILEGLLAYAQQSPYKIRWGTGKIHCSFGLKYEPLCRRSVVTVWPYGVLVLNFGWLKGSVQADVLRERLKEAAVVKLGLEIPSEYPRVWATYPISEWGSKAKALTAVLDELLQISAVKLARA